MSYFHRFAFILVYIVILADKLKHLALLTTAITIEFLLLSFCTVAWSRVSHCFAVQENTSARITEVIAGSDRRSSHESLAQPQTGLDQQAVAATYT